MAARRTRIKFCGLTRADDVAAAVEAGADAIGFNCWAGSRRYVAPHRVAELANALPVFVTPVLLFVDAAPDLIEDLMAAVPRALLQFHGDEPEPACARYGRPYLRAVRMAAGVALLDCEARYASASALLADADSPGYGGSGLAFDWLRVPAQRGKPLVLAGGLTAANVGAAIAAVRPYAVDTSSGIEDAPGIKSAQQMRAFIAAVQAADMEA